MRSALVGLVLTALLALPHAPTHAQSTPTPSAAMIDRCRALMTNPAAAAEAEANTAAAIYVVEPGDTVIYGDTLYVTVDTNNFAIRPDTGDHWHLWLNGQLNTMVYDEQVAVKVEPGTYELCAILGDREHFDLGQPDGMRITVIAAGPGTPVTQPISSGYAAPIREDSSGILVAIVVAGAAAAALGWWAGRMLPKLRKSA